MRLSQVNPTFYRLFMAITALCLINTECLFKKQEGQFLGFCVRTISATLGAHADVQVSDGDALSAMDFGGGVHQAHKMLIS
mmetsp:Transcript_28212/g.67921  ORF Transcript_28212/g.67921 Transcript_28212/m.67921 type:complete len:81 (+) Transcript_28212:850-1092(+)